MELLSVACPETPNAAPKVDRDVPARSSNIVSQITSPVPSAGISPRARHLAADQGVDAGTLAGSGPGGRVIARDVQAADSMAIILKDSGRHFDPDVVEAFKACHEEFWRLAR